jgi:hypothetical protein
VEPGWLDSSYSSPTPAPTPTPTPTPNPDQVEPGWLERVGAPCEAEQDMLDLAHEPRPNSRLGCCIQLRPELEGMVVHIPGGANNLMDHIPFE